MDSKMYSLICGWVCSASEWVLSCILSVLGRLSSNDDLGSLLPWARAEQPACWLLLWRGTAHLSVLKLLPRFPNPTCHLHGAPQGHWNPLSQAAPSPSPHNEHIPQVVWTNLFVERIRCWKPLDPLKKHGTDGPFPGLLSGIFLGSLPSLTLHLKEER